MVTAGASENLPHEAIRQQLEKIQRSRLFSKSIRLCKFLQFIVEHALDGKGDLLKEYLIGAEVYHRRPPYDPTLDSIVRTEARRLRAKLKQYYETEGRNDRVAIHLGVGGYVPFFILRASGTARDNKNRLTEGNDGLIGVSAFQDLAQTPFSTVFAYGLSEEIAQVLIRRGMFCATEGRSRFSRSSQSSGELSSQHPGCRFEGTILEGEGVLRVLLSLIRSDGRQMASLQFEMRTDVSVVAEPWPSEQSPLDDLPIRVI